MKNYFLLYLILIYYSCSQQSEWVNISLNSKDDLHDVEVLNKNIALTYSYGTGKLFKTTNSGKSWKQIHQFDSVYFEQIQFINNKTGWICGSPNKLYKTNDGGNTWIDISVKNKPNYYIYGMLFTTEKTGYFSGMYRTQKGMLSDLYKTIDGGKNWKLFNTIKAPISHIKKLGNSIYGIGNNIILKDIQKEQYSISFVDTTYTVGAIRDISINNSGNIKAVSFKGYLLSLNKNKWTTQQITKNRLRSISNINNTWVIAGDSLNEPHHIFKSIDNGNTWNPFLSESADIHRIFKSENQLWLAGKKGNIIKMDIK